MEYSALKFDTDDQLDRKTFIKNLMQIIDEWNKLKHENDSLVITVDSPWGSGKSYLLNMWKNWLISEENSDKNYCVTYYNAWENDDCDNSFIPFVYKLQEMDVYEKNIEFCEKVKDKTKSFLKSCAVALLKDGIKKAIGEEIANLISEGIDGTADGKIDNFFDKYRLYLDQKEKFRDALFELIPNDGKLIVFVDELDRCRPTFAVETLEIVKHYCNIKNIVFVFAVDLEQLAHSISTMYGNGMDSAGYLRRFFDININIPAGDIDKYVKYILHTNIDKMCLPENFTDIIVNVYTKLNLTLRDIDKISNNFIVFCLYYKHIIEENIHSQPNEISKKLEVYLYFITLKYKNPTIYNMILKQEFMSYDNAPKMWDILDRKYFISTNISNMLKDIQTGRAQKKENILIYQYGLKEVNSDGLSFSEHIERTLEMFS